MFEQGRPGLPGVLHPPLWPPRALHCLQVRAQVLRIRRAYYQDRILGIFKSLHADV
jgi:hypothetical protein